MARGNGSKRRIDIAGWVRRLALASVIGAGVAAFWLPAPAGAATVTIGQVAPADATPSSCFSGCDEFQKQDDPAAPSYTVPAGTWTVTSWSLRGGPRVGPAALQIYRPTGTPGQFRLTAQSAETPIPAGGVTSCATRLAVLPGDLLGLRGGPQPIAYATPNSGDEAASVLGEPVIGSTVGPPGSNFGYGFNNFLAVNVSATLDSAPASDADPPETTIRKRPRKVDTRTIAKFTFTSDEACPRFECKLDKKPLARCTSPFKGAASARRAPHRFKVRAIDPLGNVDRSFAKLRWHVAPRK
jgi:hypothetical protein